MRFFLFDKYLYANCSAERIVELNWKKTVEKQEKIRNNTENNKILVIMKQKTNSLHVRCANGENQKKTHEKRQQSENSLK